MRSVLVFPQALPFILLINRSLVSAAAKNPPFPDFGSAKDFASARGLCSVLFAGGSGWGRVDYATYEAKCINFKKMSLTCVTLRPHFGDIRPEEYSCDFDPHQVCVGHDLGLKPNNLMKPDAGCITPPTATGVKTEGNYACTSTVRPTTNLRVASTVATDDPKQQDLIGECDIQEGPADAPPVSSTFPCTGANTAIFDLIEGHTYRACIYVGKELMTHFRFHWTIKPQSLGPGRRDADSRSLSELFVIDDSTPGAEGARIEFA